MIFSIPPMLGFTVHTVVSSFQGVGFTQGVEIEGFYCTRWCPHFRGLE